MNLLLLFTPQLYSSLVAHHLVIFMKQAPEPTLELTSNNMKKPSGHSVGVDNTTKLIIVGIHISIKGTMRGCEQCSARAKPVRSLITCKECDVALCLECFALFHAI